MADERLRLLERRFKSEPIADNLVALWQYNWRLGRGLELGLMPPHLANNELLNTFFESFSREEKLKFTFFEMPLAKLWIKLYFASLNAIRLAGTRDLFINLNLSFEEFSQEISITEIHWLPAAWAGGDGKLWISLEAKNAIPLHQTIVPVERVHPGVTGIERYIRDLNFLVELSYIRLAFASITETSIAGQETSSDKVEFPYVTCPQCGLNSYVVDYDPEAVADIYWASRTGMDLEAAFGHRNWEALLSTNPPMLNLDCLNSENIVEDEHDAPMDRFLQSPTYHYMFPLPKVWDDNRRPGARLSTLEMKNALKLPDIGPFFQE